MTDRCTALPAIGESIAPEGRLPNDAEPAIAFRRLHLLVGRAVTHFSVHQFSDWMANWILRMEESAKYCFTRLGVMLHEMRPVRAG